METRKFKNRLEELRWKDAQQGWGPLTDEERAAIDDAVRMVTNLKPKTTFRRAVDGQRCCPKLSELSKL